MVITDDGSPSVRMGSPTQIAEVMHHSGGALTESLYIYFAAIQRTIELGLAPRFLSVGLGIGYNEAIAAAYLLKLGRSDEIEIASFEIDPVLRDHYMDWLVNSGEKSMPPPSKDINFKEIFTDVLNRIAVHFLVDANELHTTLSRSFLEKRFKIFSALERRPPLNAFYTCILFDAFSKKSTPDLWEEAFLVEFLKDACASQCVLATYAATGNLNRALRGSQFKLLRRPGFQGKRESTWAERLIADVTDKNSLE